MSRNEPPLKTKAHRRLRGVLDLIRDAKYPAARREFADFLRSWSRLTEGVESQEEADALSSAASIGKSFQPGRNADEFESAVMAYCTFLAGMEGIDRGDPHAIVEGGLEFDRMTKRGDGAATQFATALK